MWVFFFLEEENINFLSSENKPLDGEPADAQERGKNETFSSYFCQQRPAVSDSVKTHKL